MRNWRALRITPRAIVTLLKARRAGQGLSESCAKVLISPDTEPAHRARVLAAWDANVALEGLPALTVIKQLLAAGRFGPWRALRRLNLPVLVMVGDRDVFVPARNSEFIAAQVPQARLVRLAGAAHEFTDDHPEASAAAVDAFLGEIEARA
jgi:pimeloyl-ACP methyl ester carboxylesterase